MNEKTTLQFLTDSQGAALFAPSQPIATYRDAYQVFQQSFPTFAAAEAAIATWRQKFAPNLSLLIRPPNLFVKALFLDMDSTVIKEESVDELARVVGCYEEVSRITQEAMEGRLDFAAAFQQRMALLQGIRKEKMLAIAEGFTLHQGIREVLSHCRESGIKVFLISGGLLPMIEVIAHKLGISEVHGNALEFIDGKATGKLIGPLVNGLAKAAYLRAQCARFGFSRENVLAVGDGANDRYMMQEAAAAVGFHPHKVLYTFINSLNHSSSHDILCWLLDITAAANFIR
jgi:phosphoserine phosphatase SerB